MFEKLQAFLIRVFITDNLIPLLFFWKSYAFSPFVINPQSLEIRAGFNRCFWDGGLNHLCRPYYGKWG